MSKREKERIERAFIWVQRKLNTNYHLVFQAFDAAKEKDMNPRTWLTVIRSDRELEDPLCFLVGYDPKNTKGRSFHNLKQDALHELIHAINWNKRDMFEEALTYVKGVKLKKMLRKKFYDADEASTYIMERAVGPHVIPGYRSES